MQNKGQSLPTDQKQKKKISRNVWAVGITSFLMDISSEMVINILLIVGE